MSNRVLGIVTQIHGRFLCRHCQSEIVMVAIIDSRNVKARIWREVTEHECDPVGSHPNSDSVVDKNGDYFWDVMAAGAPSKGSKA